MILYASETYYNLTESETRQLERIKEIYLRRLLSTPRSCPISQIYLETGQYPARFEIMKKKLLFLKYILNQEEESTIYKFLQLQTKFPIRGDFVSSCISIMKQLKINLTFDEIKIFPVRKLKSLIISKINQESLDYLLKKRKSKGHEIEYKTLQTSDYLLPNKIITDINDKRILFSLKNKMLRLSNDIGKQEQCICKSELDLIHIYECKTLNSSNISIMYNRIYNGTLIEQQTILNRMKINLEKRQEIINKSSSLP